MDRDRLRSLLLKHEGLCLKPYTDSAGKLSIGCGRNLTDVGLTEQEALYLLDNDMARSVTYCREAFQWFNGLCDARQNVVASMVFNLGAHGFSEFKKLIAAIDGKNYDEAANQMLSSHWASQVGKRAVELADMMRMGDPLH